MNYVVIIITFHSVVNIYNNYYSDYVYITYTIRCLYHIIDSTKIINENNILDDIIIQQLKKSNEISEKAYIKIFNKKINHIKLIDASVIHNTCKKFKIVILSYKIKYNCIRYNDNGSEYKKIKSFIKNNYNNILRFF